MCSPKSSAIRYIEGAFRIVSTSSPAFAASIVLSIDVTTPCVIDRLPAVIMQTARSPGASHENIFPKRETLSTPAFVRVSDSMTRPAFSFSARQ